MFQYLHNHFLSWLYLIALVYHTLLIWSISGFARLLYLLFFVFFNSLFFVCFFFCLFLFSNNGRAYFYHSNFTCSSFTTAQDKEFYNRLSTSVDRHFLMVFQHAEYYSWLLFNINRTQWYLLMSVLMCMMAGHRIPLNSWTVNW